jgi:flagellar biosynthetic protein FliR
MQLNFPILALEAFIMVFSRVGGIMFFAPILGGKPIPKKVKAAIAFWLAVSLFPQVDPGVMPSASDAFGFTFALLHELLIGMTIGLVGQIINISVQFGGHIIGTHIGIRISNVFDPVSPVTATILGAYMNVIVVLLLLSMDFHLIILGVVKKSYLMIPVGGVVFRMGLVDIMIHMIGTLFIFAVQIVFPVLASIFFVEVIIGVLAKTAKQFNVMMLQFPIKILVGLIFFSILLKGFPEAVGRMLQWVIDNFDQLLTLMSP